jgi:hypothetical protein
MNEKKYAAHFITHGKAGLKSPEFRTDLPDDFAHHLVYLDGEVIPGSGFHVDFVWFRPRERDLTMSQDVVVEKPHRHAFDEVITFIGSNPKNIHDLCGEIEFWIDGEQHLINKSFMAFIPAGLNHGPINIRRIERPILHYVAGPGKRYE